MTWVDVVQPEDATGMLKELYDEQARHLGRPTEITMAGSLYPDLVGIRMELYRVVEACPSSLTPADRQGVALCAASVFGSKIITAGVEHKFLAEGGSPQQAEALKAGRTDVLSPGATQLALYGRKVAADPASVTEDDVMRCRAAGASDLDVLDANNLAGYYSYLARVCLGLGILGSSPA